MIPYSISDPFYWAWLQMAKVPFSDDIAHHVLDNLKDPEFVQTLIDDLRAVFTVCSNTILCTYKLIYMELCHAFSILCYTLSVYLVYH